MKCPAVGDHEIILGDSRKMLACVPENSVDLVVTSPPYFNARDYSQWATYDAYLNDMRTIVRGSKAALKEGQFMVVDIAPVIIPREKRQDTSKRIPLHFHFGKILEDEGFDFYDDITWEKPVESVGNKRANAFGKHGTPLGFRPYPTNEHILVYRKHSDKPIDVNIRSKSPEARASSKVTDMTELGETWHIHPAHNKDHPAVFPDELASRVIKLYSYKGDRVLDPFLGSGTTCVVAKKEGRRCIGIEKKKEYHDLSMRRVENA